MAMFDSTPTRLVAIAALALGLQGCASMTKNECVTADWHAIGFESGVRGQSESQISMHRKACAEHGVTPNLERFLEGHDKGLQRYCEPRNGYRLGRDGTSYNGVCPQRLEAAFTQAYHDGRELYDSEQIIDRLRQRINTKQKELKSLDHDLAERQAEIIAARTPTPRRAQLLTEINNLRDRKKSLELDIDDAHVKRDRERTRLTYLERRDVGR